MVITLQNLKPTFNMSNNMSNPGTLLKLASLVGFLCTAPSLQAQSPADPGMSGYNYKMPNKAKTDPHFTGPMAPDYIANMHQNTKHGLRPATIIFMTRRKHEPVNINPLGAVAHYKTRAASKVQVEPGEFAASLK
jgi:hypothetical protein